MVEAEYEQAAFEVDEFEVVAFGRMLVVTIFVSGLVWAGLVILLRILV